MGEAIKSYYHASSRYPWTCIKGEVRENVLYSERGREYIIVAPSMSCRAIGYFLIKPCKGGWVIMYSIDKEIW